MNRTAAGDGITLLASFSPAVWPALLAGLVFAAMLAAKEVSALSRKSAMMSSACAWAASATAPIALVALALGSERLCSGISVSTARVSFGIGFWLALSSSYAMVLVAAESLLFSSRKKHLWLSISAAALTVLLLSVADAYSSLGIAREFANRADVFPEAFATHVLYALASTTAAAMVAMPFGRAAAKFPKVEKPLFFLATAVQTVPTLSLLGLLVLPLSALGNSVPALGSIGVRGVGWAPASIALFLYALLPIAANARGGFALVPRESIDAAKGLGMGERQLFLRVELPLAAPSLVAGFRIALTQNVGNTVLAGLIGGGGLGKIVFQGLAQGAPDLILLGALPVVAVSFAADRALGSLEAALRGHSGLISKSEGLGEGDT